MKKSNESGSICKLKRKRRKPWYIRVTIEFSNDGKQIRKSIGIFAIKNILLATYKKIVNFIK